jgi:SAM-dependent methyltransferase
MTSELHWLFFHARRAGLRKTKEWARLILAWRAFWRDYSRYKSFLPDFSEDLAKHLTPCIRDNTQSTPVDASYFYQDTWAFEKILQQKPAFHVDVGSHHKFVGLLSKVLPVTMVDIRPLPVSLDSLCFKAGTVLDLPYPDLSVPSVSSLCVIEHIGLGRYGDPLDINGTQKALKELQRIVAPKGDLYLSLPIDDDNRTYFNAHRAFKTDYLEQLFKPFIIMERRFIYGRSFGEYLHKGFGTACYHLRHSK